MKRKTSFKTIRQDMSGNRFYAFKRDEARLIASFDPAPLPFSVFSDKGKTVSRVWSFGKPSNLVIPEKW